MYIHIYNDRFQSLTYTVARGSSVLAVFRLLTLGILGLG